MSDPNMAPPPSQQGGGGGDFAGPAPHPHSLRPEAISSAVSFLSDSKVASAPLSQRISFLESKGLSAAEIDAAVTQTGAGGGMGGGGGAMMGPRAGAPGGGYYGAGPYGVPPHIAAQQAAAAAAQQQGRDWRDWFIMAVVSGTVGYGLVGLAKKYLFPHLQPPNATILESDLEALTAKYDEVAAQLAALEAESQGIRAGLEAQRDVVEASVKEVEQAVTLVRSGEKKREADMDDIKREIDRIKDDIPRMFDKHREAQSASLSDVQAELKSLKSLLISRGAASSGSGAAGGSSSTNNAAAPSSSPFPSSMSASALGRGSSSWHSGLNDSTTTASSSSAQGTGTGTTNSPKTTPSFFQPPAKPSIPAWQLAPSSSSSSSASTATPAATESSTGESKDKDSHATINGTDPADE